MFTKNLFTDLGILIVNENTISKIMDYIHNESVDGLFINGIMQKMKESINEKRDYFQVDGLNLFSDMESYKEDALIDLSSENVNTILNYFLYYSSEGIIKKLFFTKSPLYSVEEIFQNNNLLVEYYRKNLGKFDFELEEGCINIVVNDKDVLEIIKLILFYTKNDILIKNFTEMFDHYELGKYELILQKYY